MKITITNEGADLDPLGEHTEDEVEAVSLALERAHEKALKVRFPDAEIEFGGEDTTYCVIVTGTDLDDPCDTQLEVQRICESVWELGDFWI